MIKRILITGAPSGIGFAAATEMIKQGHNLIITMRKSSSKSNLRNSFFKEGIKKSQLANQVKFYTVDLADLKSIESFIDLMLIENLPLDTLILNAGLQYTGSKEVRRSHQNIELTFAVNHLSHQYIA